MGHQHTIDYATLTTIAHKAGIDPTLFHEAAFPTESGSCLSLTATDTEVTAFCDAADAVLAELAQDQGEGLLVLSDHLRVPRTSRPERGTVRTFQWPTIRISTPN